MITSRNCDYYPGGKDNYAADRPAHAIPDSDDPHAIVAKLMAAVPTGNCLAFSHVGADLLDEDSRTASRTSSAG